MAHQTPVTPCIWAYKLHSVSTTAPGPQFAACTPANMEIWWVCLKCPCMCSYSQGVGGWETTTSAASQMCNCHLGPSSAFRGEVKWLQWATAEGDVAWRFLTFPWNEVEAFTQATLKYLLEGKSWWVVKSHFQNCFSAVSLWTGQLSCSACACMAGLAGLLLAFQTCCIFLW